MNNLRNILLTLLAWGICAFQAPAAEESKPKPPESMTATLFPGETLTYQGVSVTWVVEPGEQRPKSDTEITTPAGHLKFVGPTAKLDNVPLKFRPQYATEPKGHLIGWTMVETDLSLDQVVVLVGGVEIPGGYGTHVQMSFQEKEKHFDGADHILTVYLSYVCPIRLNQWELTLSEKPARYPDGSEFFQITARNTETGEKVVIPAAQNVTKKAGRFNIEISRVWPETRTVGMQLYVQKDLSIRGRDAYAEVHLGGGEALGDFLDGLSKKYGFEVEWVAVPEGDAESVQYCRKSICNSGSNRQGVLKEKLDEFLRAFQPKVEAEWRDATHLRVWATDYAKVAEEKKARERDAAEEKRKDAEKSQELPKLRALFYQKYTPVTRVYSLQKLSAKTAKELLGPQIPQNYYLFGGINPNPSDPNPLAGDHFPGEPRMPLLEKGKYYFVTAVPVEELQERAQEDPLKAYLMGCLEAQANESVLADERSNTLIVTAVPQTHEKIAQILKQADQMIDTRAAAGPILRFRVEVVLLQGRKEGAEPAESAEGTPLSFLTNGILTEVKVRPGDRVKAGDVIARLDTLEIQGKVGAQNLSLNENKDRLENAQRELTSAKRMQEYVSARERDVINAQHALARSEMAMKGLQDQMERYTLKSLSDGTVTWVAELQPGQEVRSGEPVARLIPAPPSSDKTKEPGKEAKNPEKVVEKKPEKKEPTLAERYGISAEDLQLLGAKSLSEMGRGVLSLSGDKGETGRVVVNLTPQYQCELQYQDYRSPYLIARARLQSPAAGGGAAKPVIENTVYLEPGKPSAEGITNLSEALILVVQLHDIQAMGFGQMAQGTQEITLNTNNRDMRNLGPLSLRLSKVNENDPNNDRDDTCELIVNTPEEIVTITLDESGQAQFTRDWQWQAIDVRPTSGTKTGEGSARIRIRYAPDPRFPVKKKAPVDVASLIAQGAQEITLSTTARDMKTMGPLSLRLRRVNQNDAKNDRDDTCELIVNTDTQSMTVTLDEGGAPQYVEDWRFQAMDVRPTSGTKTTQGTARIRIRYVPAGTRGQDTGTDNDLIPPGGLEITLRTDSKVMKDVGPLRLGLRRVTANDPNDDRHDKCEVIVCTQKQSMDINLEEGGAPQFVEDWRFQAVDVRPAGGANSTQDGTARIRITRPSAGR